MRLYNALQLAGSPDLSLQPVDVWYQADLYNVWLDGDGKPTTPHPLKREGLRRVAIGVDGDARLDPDAIPDEQLDRLIARSAGSLVAIDEEHLWGKLDPRLHRIYDPPAATFRDVDKAHDFYRRLVLRIRRRPGGAGLRLGHYGIGTQIIHDHLRGDAGQYAADLARAKYDWDEIGKRFRDTGLLDVVDVIFPSLYFTAGPNLPARNALMIETLARLHDKPLIPFVSPLWDGGDNGGTFVPDELVVEQQAMLKPYHADDRVEAVCLWSGPGKWSGQWGQWVESWRAA